MCYTNWRSIRPTRQLSTVLSTSCPTMPMSVVLNRVLLYKTVYYFDIAIVCYANWRSIWPTHQLPTVLSASFPVVHFVYWRMEKFHHLMMQSYTLPSQGMWYQSVHPLVVVQSSDMPIGGQNWPTHQIPTMFAASCWIEFVVKFQLCFLASCPTVFSCQLYWI